MLRLNTYSTLSPKWNDDTIQSARSVEVLTVASPSAVRNWVENVGLSETLVVAAIGPVTAAAACEAGFRVVFSGGNDSLRLSDNEDHIARFASTIRKAVSYRHMLLQQTAKT